MTPITREALRGYLNESLPDAEMTAVERAVRDDPKAQALLKEVREEVDRGEHSLGAIWRRERLSCPTRDQLGGYLLQALDPDLQDYIAFHLQTVGCPFCSANLEDLERKQAEAEAPTVRKRRRRIVDSSAGVLKHVTGK